MAEIEDIERKRAKHALECVKKVKEDRGKRKEYRQLAQKLPAYLQENGLAQTLAFIKSKGGVHEIIYKDFQGWLLEGLSVPWKSDNKDLLERVLEEESIVYMHASDEAMSFAGWLKRLAAAEIPEDGDAQYTS